MERPNDVILFNPPAGANVEFPDTEILEEGFFDGDPDTPLRAKNYNAFEKQNSSWLKYLSIFLKQYYVSTTLGSDTTGDGTSGMPYATIGKAVEQVGHGQYGEVILMDSDSFDIEADIDMYNSKIYIHEASGINAQIRHIVYGASNTYYRFNLYNSCELRISVKKYMLEDVDAGKATASSACGIASVSGNNKIDIYTYDAGGGGGLFLPTNNGTSNFPAIVKNIPTSSSSAFTVVSVPATYIVTGKKGYVFDTAGLPSALYSPTTLDYPDFWVANGITNNQILTTGLASTSIGASITMYVNGSAIADHKTATLNDTDADADIKSAILAVFDALFEMAYVNFVFSTVRTSAPAKVRSMTIEMTGDFAGKSLPFSFYFAGTDRSGYFYESQKAERNLNVVTNISKIK